MEEVKCFKTTITTMSWFVFCYVILSCHVVSCVSCHAVSCLVWLVLPCLLSCLGFCALSCVILACFVIGLCYLMLELSMCRFVFVLTCPFFVVELPCTVLSSLTYLALPYRIFILSCFALPSLAFSFRLLAYLVSRSPLVLWFSCLVLLFVSCLVIFFLSSLMIVLCFSCLVFRWSCLVSSWVCAGIVWIFLSSSVHNQNRIFQIHIL